MPTGYTSMRGISLMARSPLFGVEYFFESSVVDYAFAPHEVEFVSGALEGFVVLTQGGLIRRSGGVGRNAP